MSDVDYGVFMGSTYTNTISAPLRPKSKYLSVIDYPAIKQKYGIEKIKLVPNGEYVFDFLPFPVSPAHPRFKELTALFQGGTPLDWQLSVFLHKVQGENGEQKFICPKKTFGKPCFFCDESYRLYLLGTPESKIERKKFNDVQRDFYIVRNHADGKVYIMEYSNYLFGERLQKKLSRTNSSNVQVILPKPTANGHSLHFWIEESTTMGKDGKPFIGEINEIEFVPRPEPIDPEILKSLPALDEFLVQYTNEEIISFHDGTYFIGAQEDEEGSVNNFAPVSQPVTSQVNTTQPVVNLTSNVEQKSNVVIGGRAPIGFQTSESVAEAQNPFPQVSQEPATKHVEIQQPSVSDMTREERRKLRGARNTQVVTPDPVCPAGGEFGRDIDSFDSCLECGLYQACEEKYNSTNNV